VRFAETRALARDHGDDGADFSALLIGFLEADDEAEALAEAYALLPEDDFAILTEALDHFRARYAAVWSAGAWIEPFLGDVREGGAARRLAEDLRTLARFYHAPLPLDPVPRVVLVPVPGGSGTHATARGRNLLIELRPADRLVDTASVLAHENAHVLFERMPGRKRENVEAVFLAEGAAGAEAWNVLREALPTALGQGVFDRAYRPGAWTDDAPWYHLDEVDRYAKAIFPVVLRAFERGRPFDRRLARELWEAYPDRIRVTPR
jgi:hypothetical protein